MALIHSTEKHPQPPDVLDWIIIISSTLMGAVSLFFWATKDWDGNWWNALFWTVAGSVIGALIGTVVAVLIPRFVYVVVLIVFFMGIVYRIVGPIPI